MKLFVGCALVTSSQEIKKAFSQLSNQLKADCQIFKNHSIGWPSGNGRFTVYWHARHKFWVILEPNQRYYWCGYGLADPSKTLSLEFTVQINPPRIFEGHPPAGAFLMDDAGNFWLAHTGKLTKGHGSLGTQFIGQHTGGVETILWPNGHMRTFLLVGRIDHPKFLQRLKAYITNISDFKRLSADFAPVNTQTKLNLEFVPEQEGYKAPYKKTGEVASFNRHGYVINGLQKLLAPNYQTSKTGLIDLYLFNKAGKMTHIFEAKSAADRYSIYSGVGQLLLHAALDPGCQNRILVLPSKPKADLQARLKELGIVVLQYKLKGQVPTFLNLDEVI